MQWFSKIIVQLIENVIFPFDSLIEYLKWSDMKLFLFVLKNKNDDPDNYTPKSYETVNFRL